MRKKKIKSGLHALKSNRGFTLIEMVIATALVAIFFTMAATVLPTWFQSYKNIITMSYARQISNSIAAVVESQIMFADGVRLKDGTDSGAIEGKGQDGKFIIPVNEGGTLVIEGLVYDEAFYRGLDVDLSFTVDTGKTCTITIEVYDTGRVKILTKTRVIKLVGKPA